MIKKYNDIDSILIEIRSGKAGRDSVIRQLYYDDQLKNSMRAVLYKMGAKESDFNPLFNSTLMGFIKTVVKKKDLVIKSTLNTYIIGIAKYNWYGELRQQKKAISRTLREDYQLDDAITPEDLLINSDQKELIQTLLSHLGKKCKEVLMYWANGYKMLEIADMLGYKSEGMAKKKKHVCFKELLLFVDKNPHVKKVLR